AGAVFETGKAGGDDAVGGVDTLDDYGRCLGLQPHRDGPQNDALVGLHDVGEGAMWPALHGRGWNGHHLLQRVGQHAHVDELPRPELQVGVGEFRLHAHGPGRLVHLVVDDLQGAAVEHRLAVGVERLDRHLAPCGRGVDLGQLLLRQREDYGDWPDLRDHHDAGVGVDGTHQVALVDHADAGATV